MPQTSKKGSYRPTKKFLRSLERMSVDLSLPLKERLAAADLLAVHLRLGVQQNQEAPEKPVYQEPPERRKVQEQLREILQAEQNPS